MINLKKGTDPSGYTLIVPAISVGNVAQLALDLLIYNGQMKKIGQLVSSDFIPFLGGDPYNDRDSSDICTTAEFYVEEKTRVIALQIRSPSFTDKFTNFFVKLRDFINEWRIAEVVILSGEWQYVRNDEQLGGEATRYLASACTERRYSSQFRRLGWKKLEERVDPSSGSARLEISGGGFALGLFQFLSAEKISCAVLLKFCSEGDNGPDALQLARFFDSWMPLVSKNCEENVVWKEPPSWRHAFGCQTPRHMY